MRTIKNPFEIHFGTDGWRGLIDDEINQETISVVARAFADYLVEREENEISVAIAYDGRKNSQLFAELFAQVLSAQKINVYLSDKVTPAPVLSYFVKHNSLTGGVMITASHNPPKYNGVKFKAAYGGPFLTEETLKVEKLLYMKSYNYDKSRVEKVDMLRPYIEHITPFINFDVIRQSRIYPLIDSMSGAGRDIIKKILDLYQIQAEVIFDIPEENFHNRLPEPIEKNLIPLSQKLNTGSYSIGLATDGDADRIGVMLENGKWLSAQETILYLVDHIIKKKKYSGHIVKTCSVTDKINFFQNDERKVYDVQVGFKYICEKMISEDVAIGCEESGGNGFKYHIPERDGILSGLLLCEMIGENGFQRISDFVNYKRTEFGLIYYDRIDDEYLHPHRTKKLPALSLNPPEKIANFKTKKISTFFGSHGEINGIKFYLEGENRWLLIRASETEPVFRYYAEANSYEEVSILLKSGIELINTTKI